MSPTRPWHGVLVATALPFRDDLTVDLDRYAEHVRWLADEGCDGVTPNGSLGEYQTLTPDERSAVVRTAVSAAPDGFAVMLLPPNAYRADERAVIQHYRAVASVGLPVVAYNNPIDTKVDLQPELLARLHAEGLIVGVKEFSGDVRRAYRIAELAPDLDLLAGADDVTLELVIAGAVGWVSGYPNVFPRKCVELFAAAMAGDVATAVGLYRDLHPVLRWDSRTEFVQAIKLSMDIVGRYGGPSRPPRLPLVEEHAVAVREATEKLVASGY